MTQIELNGQTVARVADDRPLRVHIGSDWLVTAESAMTFTDADGAVRHFQGDDPETASALAPLLTGRTIESSVIKDGSLRLVFTDGAELFAPPDPHYESWNVTGPNRLLIVCTPGGELAIWSDEELAP